MIIPNAKFLDPTPRPTERRAGAGSIWQNLKGQIYLGDERFVRRMQARHHARAGGDSNVPRAHRRRPAPALSVIAARHKDRDKAVLAAYDTGAYSYQQIAEHFGIHFTTAGRIVRAGRRALWEADERGGR